MNILPMWDNLIINFYNLIWSLRIILDNLI